MIHQKYKKIRRLGRGAFGQVFLVQDQQGNQFAMKEMDLVKLKAQQNLEYIENQIKVMQTLNSEYIVRLQASYKTQRNVYIILEYCNGGDLKKDMNKQPQKVYNLQQTAKILSDVIRGLQIVHTNGYLHRDVKVENILVKIDQKENKVYKIADFGLSKSSDKGETVLGTGSYMSPEIYNQQQYGFEVDMWAFAIVMYFMLNKEYPFKLSPPMSENYQRQYQELTNQSKNFSYQKFVKNSKFKLVQNCTPQVEDLFSKMLDLDPNNRITFSDIRSHPIFKPYFPDQISSHSMVMYKSKKFKVQGLGKNATKKLNNVQNQNIGLRESVALNISHTQKFPKQRQLLFQLNNQSQFLYNNYKQFSTATGILSPLQKVPLCYNLLKYYIILKRNYIQFIKTQRICQAFPQLQLRQFFKTVSYRKQLRQFEDQLDNAIISFQTLHSQCQVSMNSIDQINSAFRDAFHAEIIERDFVDPFKKSYRKSTLYVFNKMKKFLQEKNTGNKTNYFLMLAVISHVFNRLFSEKQNVQKVFKDFLQQYQVSAQEIDYDKLREWMSKASPNQLNAVTKNIINKYFEKS